MDDYFTYELISKVRPLDDGRLDLVFRNGVHGVFDVRPYFADPYWKRLAEPAFFNQVSLECGTLVWPDDIDIAPEEVWHGVVRSGG